MNRSFSQTQRFEANGVDPRELSASMQRAASKMHLNLSELKSTYEWYSARVEKGRWTPKEELPTLGADNKPSADFCVEYIAACRGVKIDGQQGAPEKKSEKKVDMPHPLVASLGEAKLPPAKKHDPNIKIKAPTTDVQSNMAVATSAAAEHLKYDSSSYAKHLVPEVHGRRGEAIRNYETNHEHIHAAQDLYAPKGSSVTFPYEKGKVIATGEGGTTGNWMYIELRDKNNKPIIDSETHRPLGMLTMHHDQILVSDGDTVSRGQHIATVGTTGFQDEDSHLHVEFGTRDLIDFGGKRGEEKLRIFNGIRIARNKDVFLPEPDTHEHEDRKIASK